MNSSVFQFRFSSGFVLISALVLSACGVGSDNPDLNLSNSPYSYHFKENSNASHCDAGLVEADTLEEHCQQLQNDNLNHQCAASQRRETFRSECEPAGFTWNAAEPSQAAVDPTPFPLPTATPVHTATPAPTAPPIHPGVPDNRPDLVKEFSAQGIEIEVRPVPGTYPLPGQASFSQRLVVFYQTLASNKAAFFARKNLFPKLVISTYTYYQADFSILTMDVDFTSSDIQTYFKSLDQSRNLEKQAQISFDFGTQSHDDGIKSYEAEVDFFAKADLSLLSGLIKVIKIEDQDYYSSVTGELSLNEKTYNQSFLAFTQKNSLLLGEMQKLNAQHVQLDFGIGSFNFFKDFVKLAQIGKTFQDSELGLLALGKQGKITKIGVSPFGGNPRFYSNLHELDLNGDALINIPAISLALFGGFAVADSIQAKLDVPDELTLDFVLFANRLAEVRDALLTKKGKIRELDYSAGTVSDFQYQTLTIGIRSSSPSLLKVIQDI